MRCHNLRVCPGTGNCHQGFVLRASTLMVVVKLIIFSFLLFPFSDSCLVCPGFIKKPFYPTHWTSLTPLPLSHTFLPLIIPVPGVSGSHAGFGPWSFCSLPPGMVQKSELLGCLISWSLPCGMLLFSVCCASTKAIFKFLLVFRPHPSFPVQ